MNQTNTVINKNAFIMFYFHEYIEQHNHHYCLYTYTDLPRDGCNVGCLILN